MGSLKSFWDAHQWDGVEVSIFLVLLWAQPVGSCKFGCQLCFQRLQNKIKCSTKYTLKLTGCNTSWTGDYNAVHVAILPDSRTFPTWWVSTGTWNDVCTEKVQVSTSHWICVNGSPEEHQGISVRYQYKSLESLLMGLYRNMKGLVSGNSISVGLHMLFQIVLMGLRLRVWTWNDMWKETGPHKSFLSVLIGVYKNIKG